jgi:hypothetical protein
VKLYCAICLYVRTGVAAEAVTVIEGYAVCDDHMGYVAQGENWASIYRTAKASAEQTAEPPTDEPAR